MTDFFSKPNVRRSLRTFQHVIPIALLLLLFALLLQKHPAPYSFVSSNFQGPPLSVLTLLFGEANNLIDADIVAHNCALISKARHKFIIYTDNHTHTFCNTCTCRTFTSLNCNQFCGQPGRRSCNLCEKLIFVRDAIISFQEFVLLDSDLIIVKDSFLDRLSIRALAHDFLAVYGFAASNIDQESSESHLNTGMFFIRRLPNLNYSKMVDILEQKRTNSDQGIISNFVYDHYTNWDSLSRRWNCRLSYLRKTNYPVERCYNFHGRGDIEGLFERVNKKILRLD